MGVNALEKPSRLRETSIAQHICICTLQTPKLDKALIYSCQKHHCALSWAEPSALSPLHLTALVTVLDTLMLPASGTPGWLYYV